MKNVTKVAGAVAIAAVIAAGSSAFTAGGLRLSGQASTDQFIGGTVAQTVSGATLDSIVYGYTDGTKTSVNLVTLTFAGSVVNRTVTTAVSIGGAAQASAANFTCAIDDGTGDATAQKTSVCSPVAGPVTNLTGIAVTVA